MSFTVTEIAALVFASLNVVVAIFYLALAFGAPWGEYAMGGKFPGVFPPKMRIVAVSVLPTYFFLSYVIIARAGFVTGSHPYLFPAAWAVVGLIALATIMNLMSPSLPERRIWTPIAFLLLLTSALVASSS